MSTFDHTRKQGDTADPLSITLSDSGGAYAIPDGSDVFLTIREAADGLATYLVSPNVPAVVLDAGVMEPDADQVTNAGLCTYPWQPSDVAASGEFDFEIKVVLTDLTEIRFPRDPS